MGFWAAQKISHNIRCYDIQRIIFEETEPISYDLSTVLWPHHHYLPPGSGRLSWNNIPENIIIVIFDFKEEVNSETYNWRIFRQRHSKPHSRSHLCVCWFRQLQNLLFSPKNVCSLNSVTLILNQELFHHIAQNLDLLKRAESTDIELHCTNYNFNYHIRIDDLPRRICSFHPGSRVGIRQMFCNEDLP